MYLGPTVFKSPPMFAEGAADDEKIWSFWDFGRISPREKAAASRLYDAAYYNRIYNEVTVAQENTKVEAWERRNKGIEDLTGVKLLNPYYVARQTTTQRPDGISLADWQYLDIRYRYYQDEWKKEANRLADQFSDRKSVFALDRNIDDDTKAVKYQAHTDYEDALRSLGGWQRFRNSMAGDFVGMFTDPAQVAATVVAAGPAIAKTVLGRLATTVMAEAAINAGTEAVVQAVTYNWKRDAGINVSVSDVLKQVGIAGAFGGMIGGTVQGGREIARLFRITAKDVKTIAEKLDVPLTDVEKRMADIAEMQDEFDRAAFGALPADTTLEDSVSVMKRAAAAVEDMEQTSPVAGAEYAPARAPDVDRVVTETATGADEFLVQGKPVRFQHFDPDIIGTDARAYQYKGGGDAAGVTERLRDVQQWDPTASGKIFVHERPDGLFVVDGHQRLGLAKRLQERGGKTVKLDGYLYREADGWTAADVRALAARKNMQEGSGTALDAARILRDRPDIIDNGLPVSGLMMRKATAMARLSDDAWGMVVNGLAEEHHATVVGRLVADPDKQAAVLNDVVRYNPPTERQTEILVHELLEAGFRHELQSDMFGDMAITRSLMMERVKVLDEALKVLRQDKKLFAALSENADVISAAGNVLDEANNLNRRVTAETLGSLIDRLARSRGPVSDALTAAAERFADGSAAKKEARAFVSDVSQALDRHGLPRLLEGDNPKVLKPKQSVEPATRDGDEIASLQRLESGAEREAAAVKEIDFWDLMPEDGYAESLQRAKNLEKTANLIKNCVR